MPDCRHVEALDPEQMGEVGGASLGWKSASLPHRQQMRGPCVRLTVALTSQDRLSARHRQVFSDKNLYVDDLLHLFSRPSPKKEQSTLSLVRFELKTIPFVDDQVDL